MLKNNTVLKILSLLIAIFLWFYVMGEVNPTITKTISNIPVQLLNGDTLEQRGLAVQGDSEFVVSIEVQGKRAELNSLEKSEFKATADLFGYKEGENEVPVTVEVPDNITLKAIKNPKIKVTLEELVSVYKTVTVDFAGKTESGTEPGSVTVSPEEIEVKGAKSSVDSVRTVKAEIDASKITDEEKSFNVEPQAVDKNGDLVSGVSLSAKTVQVGAVLYYTKTVPLKVEVKGSVPEEYQVTDMSVPEKISIRGPKAALDEITSISAEPVDISGVTASTTLEIQPKLPEGIEVADSSANIGVTIKIKGLDTKTLALPTQNSRIRNLGDGLNAYVNTAEVEVTVTGSEALLKDISADDFTLFIDLKDLKEGNHAVAVKVTSDKKFNSLEIKPQQVEVTIKGQE